MWDVNASKRTTKHLKSQKILTKQILVASEEQRWNDENNALEKKQQIEFHKLNGESSFTEIHVKNSIKYKSGICRAAEKLHFLSVFFGSR